MIREHIPECGLPADVRTLLRTTRKANVVAMHPGKYSHFGVVSGLKDLLKHDWDGISTNFRLQVGTDGLPIANCGNSQLWPILGRIITSSTVFLIGCYWGKTKPGSANDFLCDFVHDMTDLIENGFESDNKKFSISLHSLVCDVPATAFALMTKGHAGYRSCGKCTIEGEYIQNRVVFLDVDCAKRTDASLYNEDDDEFQQGRSVLLDIPGFGLVSGVPNDSMHTISNAQKKILVLWSKGPKRVRILTKVNFEKL